MKRIPLNIILLALLLIPLFILKVSAQEFYVKYGVNDCINCSAQLYQLSRVLEKDKVSFLFPDQYRDDAELLIQRYALDQFNYKLIFSDSLYQAYQQGVESYFLIVKDNQPVFKAKIKEMDVAAVTEKIRSLRSPNIGTEVQTLPDSPETFLATPNSETVFCLVKRTSDDNFILFDTGSLMSYNRSLMRFTYQDMLRQELTTFLPDSSWTERIYKACYGDENYRDAYAFIRTIQQSNPNTKTEINYVIKDSNNLIFYLTGYFIDSKDTVTKRLIVSRKYFLQFYDIVQKTFTVCMPIADDAGIKDYYHNSGMFAKIKDRYYFPVVDTDFKKTSHTLCAYAVEDNKVRLQEELPFEVPLNYIRYELYDNFLDIIIRGSLFTFPYSESVYDIHNNQTRLLPLADSEFTELNSLMEEAMTIINQGSASTLNLNRFRIYDIFDGDGYYSVLYRDKHRILYSIRVDKITNCLIRKQKVELSLDHLSMGARYYFHDDNSIIYLPENEDCFRIINL